VAQINGDLLFLTNPREDKEIGNERDLSTQLKGGKDRALSSGEIR